MDTASFPKDIIKAIGEADTQALEKAHEHYGTSWKNRGGVGAFMMLARKWDRIENQAKKNGYDILEAIKKDQRAEGLIDDIRDLRRYLKLVEAEIVETLGVIAEVQKGARPTPAEVLRKVYEEDEPEQERKPLLKEKQCAKCKAGEHPQCLDACTCCDEYGRVKPPCTCGSVVTPDLWQPCPHHG